MAKKAVKKKSSKPKFNFPKKYLIFLLIILIVLGLIFFGSKLFLAASVNGKIISRFTVIKELEKQGGKSILETLILKDLIYQEAKKRKIAVSEKELKDELAKVEKNVASQGSTIDDLLKQQKMTKKDLEEQITLQLLLNKMIDGKITVTDKEVQEYLSYATNLTENEAKEMIKQQKQQEKVKTFLSDLKAKAKINYFIKY